MHQLRVLWRKSIRCLNDNFLARDLGGVDWLVSRSFLRCMSLLLFLTLLPLLHYNVASAIMKMYQD